jgi:leucyl/phenylalanyl-tRNA---protein transferase
MRLTPDLLLAAYCQGIFPMAHDDGEIYWYDPNPRAILPLETFHVPRSLARTVRQGRFVVTRNRAFSAVIHQCAALDREGTWINDEIITAYTRLHRHGFAHSVETWLEGELAGGLYGVAIGGFFAGESMFHTARDASKVALVHLVEHLRRQGFALLDTQFMTDHLRRFGAIELSHAAYKKRLAQALAVKTSF